MDTSIVCEFFVPGKPATQGSKRAFVHRNTGKVIVMDDCARNKDWRSQVAFYAHTAMRGKPICESPVRLTLVFHMARPKHHYRIDGTLKSTAPVLHTSKPDRTKLTRAVEDAMTGIVWCDDSQVCCGEVFKIYQAAGQMVGVNVTVEAIAANKIVFV